MSVHCTSCECTRYTRRSPASDQPGKGMSQYWPKYTNPRSLSASDQPSKERYFKPYTLRITQHTRLRHPSEPPRQAKFKSRTNWTHKHRVLIQPLRSTPATECKHVLPAHTANTRSSSQPSINPQRNVKHVPPAIRKHTRRSQPQITQQGIQPYVLPMHKHPRPQ